MHTEIIMDEQIQLPQPSLVPEPNHNQNKVFIFGIGALLLIIIAAGIAYLLVFNKGTITASHQNNITQLSPVPIKENPSSQINVPGIDSFAYLNKGEIWIQKGDSVKQFTHTTNDNSAYGFVVNYVKNQIYYFQKEPNNGGNNLYACDYTKDTCNPTFLTKDTLYTVNIISLSPDGSKLLYSGYNGDYNDENYPTNIKIYDFNSNITTDVFKSDYLNNIYSPIPHGWFDNNTILLNYYYVGGGGKYATYSLDLSQLPLESSTFADNSSILNMVGIGENSTAQHIFLNPISLYNNIILYNLMEYSNLTNHTQINYAVSIPEATSSLMVNEASQSGINTTNFNKFFTDVKQYPNFQFNNQDYTNVIEKINTQMAYFIVNNNPILAFCSDNKCQLKTITNNNFIDLSQVSPPQSITSQTYGDSNDTELFAYNYNNYILYSLCYIDANNKPHTCSLTLYDIKNKQLVNDFNYINSQIGIL